MKPMYQARKKIVHGITKLRRRCTSSWNSGERSIASQSISVWGRSAVRAACASPRGASGSAMSSPPSDGREYVRSATRRPLRAWAESLAAGWRFVSTPRRVLDPGGAAMQRAVHAATAILPHLRRGLTRETAAAAAPALRILTGADAVLACEGAEHHHAGDPLDTLVPARREDRVHIEPRLSCAAAGCPLRSAIVAPLAVRDRRVGVLVALYE